MSLILIIEDEDHIRENICDILGFEGYNVINANNGSTGIELATTQQPDLIICDVLMPGISGWDVLLELRSNAETAALPFVFLTALSDRGNARKGISHGADDYITKPFTTRDLLDTITTRLQRREEMRERQKQQLDQLRRNIIYALPHELRSPLTGILSCAEFLLMDHPTGLETERVQNVARIIERSGRRLQRLVENYLYFAQLELIASDPSQRAHLGGEGTGNAGGVIYDAAVERASAHEREKDVEYVLENATVRVAQDDLHKLTSELVDNACKFSAPGTPIEVTTRITSKGMLLSIRDRGRGMEPTEIQQIGAYIQFQRTLFEQQGIGLGLAIVRRLAELNGGVLEIDTRPGEGTEIRVLLPLV